MELEQVVVRLVADTSQYFRQLDYAGSRLVGFAAGVVSAVARHGIELAAAFEKSSIAIQTMTKDAAVGKQLIEDITEMAVRTPFKSAELIEQTKQLMAFGFETNQIIDILDVLGNVSAGTATPLNRIVLAFGQVRVAGKLMGTELRQFVDAGIPIIEELAKVIGQPESRIRAMVESGQIGFDLVTKAFNNMTAKGGLFSGLMDRINKQTVAGQWESLSEKVELASRKFALGAFEGLRLRQILEDISNSIGVSGNEPDSGVVDFFTGVRTVLDVIWLSGKKVYTLISDIVTVTKQWADRNTVLVAVILSLIAAFFALKATAFTFLTIIGLVGRLIALIRVLTSVTVIYNAVSALFAGLGWIVTFLPLILAVTAAVGVLYLLMKEWTEGTDFSKMENGFKKTFSEIGSLVKTAMADIKNAINAGDIDLAFEIVVTNIELMFRKMFLRIKFELSALRAGAANPESEKKANDWAKDNLLLSRSIYNIAQGFAAIDPTRHLGMNNYTPGQMMSTKEWDMHLNAQGAGLQGDLAAKAAKVREDFEKGAYDGDAGVKRLTETLKKLGEQAKAASDAVDRTRWIDDNASEIEQVRNAMLKDLAAAQKQWVEEEALNLHFRMGDKRFQSMSPEDYIKSLGKFGKPGEEGIKLPNDDGGAAREIFKRQVAWAEKYKNTFGMGSSSLPNPFDQGFMVAMLSRQIGGSQFGISGEAREYANHLLKELDKGNGPLSHFSKTMKNLDNAFQGPGIGQQFGGVIGGAGNFALKTPGGKPLLRGIIDKDAFDFGTFKAYEELRKGMGDNQKDKMSPSAYYGTTAAMDIINANRENKEDVQMQVLNTLIEAKELQRQSVEYQKKVAEAFDKLRETGQLEQFRDLPQGFQGK